MDDALETAEAALADPYVRFGDRVALQRRVLRLGKPPKRWKRPAWATAALAEPREERIVGRPLAGSVGSRNRCGQPSWSSLASSSVHRDWYVLQCVLASTRAHRLCGTVLCCILRYYGYDGNDQVNVEELVLQHYARAPEGAWTGIHTEGGVWATLFGLVFWDVLFSGGFPSLSGLPDAGIAGVPVIDPCFCGHAVICCHLLRPSPSPRSTEVPGVFPAPFQTAPLDLDSDAFFPARAAAIEAVLQDVALGGAGATLVRGFDNVTARSRFGPHPCVQNASLRNHHVTHVAHQFFRPYNCANLARTPRHNVRGRQLGPLPPRPAPGDRCLCGRRRFICGATPDGGGPRWQLRYDGSLHHCLPHVLQRYVSNAWGVAVPMRATKLASHAPTAFCRRTSRSAAVALQARAWGTPRGGQGPDRQAVGAAASVDHGDDGSRHGRLCCQGCGARVTEATEPLAFLFITRDQAPETQTCVDKEPVR